ncbi:hypothetical protein INT45_013274 [Circinella minor]|uniref:Uncharacterized protein n=1 Tax=Circinella minor TaxID=1195481 RepID=A0A8H7S5N6_9FUNG|nr:hypothetical protein INT45_013274 [Circinella minor]
MSSLQHRTQKTLDDLQNERIHLLNQCGSQFGASVIDGRIRFGIQKNEEPVYQVAFIAISTKNPSPDNKQLGGYSVVWLDKKISNQYGYHNGPPTGALIFPLMFDGNTRIDWIQKFYSIAKRGARESLDLWHLERDNITTHSSPSLRSSPAIGLTRGDSYRPNYDTESQSIPEKSDISTIGKVMQKLGDIQDTRQELLEKHKDIVDMFTYQLREEVAIIATSVDSYSDYHQLGGYGAVWLNDTIKNQFGNHEGKYESTLNFLVMATADAILQSPPDRRLLIASKNLLIVNYIIDKGLKKRSKPIRGILIEPGSTNGYLDDFYDLARKVASEAKRLRYVENSKERTLSSRSISTTDTTEKQKLIHHGVYIPDRDQSPIEQSPLITNKMDNKKFENDLKRIEEDRNKLVVEYTRSNPASIQHELRAIIGMSTESRDRKGNQMGGYGVVWIDKELPILYGHYNGPFNSTIIFVLKGIIDILVQPIKDRPIHIGMKNKVAYEYLNGREESGHKPILNKYIQTIKELISCRTQSVKFFLISNKDIWGNQFHTLARRIASEARKSRLLEGNFDNDSQSSTPSEIQSLSSTQRRLIQEEPLSITSSSSPDSSLTNDIITQPRNQQPLNSIHPTRAAMLAASESSLPVTSIDDQQPPIDQTNTSTLLGRRSTGSNMTPLSSTRTSESSTLSMKDPVQRDISKDKNDSIIDTTKHNNNVVTVNSLSPHGPTVNNKDDDITMAEVGKKDNHLSNTVTTSNKRPISSIENNNILDEPALLEPNKILDFSEWHAATQSMLEWLHTMREKIK